MYALVGLGNPGSEYDGTRHNVGFRVIDALREKLNAPVWRCKDEYQIARASVGGRRALLVKPLTYMNNSGVVVVEILRQHDVPPEQLLVICDDFQLPLGTLRLRSQGSDGGHNGLYSIVFHLRSEEFPRLRCGIASKSMPTRKTEMARFVLSAFEENELQTVEEMVTRAQDAAVAFVTEGITAAMNTFNASR